MTRNALKHLTVDSFLDQFEGQEGHWELIDGLPMAMSPERVAHGIAKTEAASALNNAIRRRGSPCRAIADSLTIRIRDDRAFVPDVVVVCPTPPLEVVAIDNPLMVVEVLSPSTAALDHGVKLEAYFSLPSLAHYLILDPERRVAIHHRRLRDDAIETRIFHEGTIRLDPPGVDVEVADLFGPEG